MPIGVLSSYNEYEKGNYISGVAIDNNGTYRFRRATWSVHGVS